MSPQTDSVPLGIDASVVKFLPGLLQRRPDALADSSICRALLKDYCEDHKREYRFLANAEAEQIPAKLLQGPGGVPFEIWLDHLQQCLVTNRAMSPDAAEWTVNVWAEALGKTQQSPPQHVPEPRISLSVSPDVIVGPGQVATLSWVAQNATQLLFEPAIGDVEMSGSCRISPLATTSYKVTAIGPGGTAESAVTVRVGLQVPQGPRGEAKKPIQVKAFPWKPAVGTVLVLLVGLVWIIARPKPLEITSVKFTTDLLPWSLLNSKPQAPPFAKDDTRHINVQVSFSRKASEDTDIEWVWTGPDNARPDLKNLSNQKHQLKSDQDTLSLSSECCDDAGHWLAGQYRVDFRANGKLIKSAAFEVKPSSLPQVQSVNFFASEPNLAGAGPYRKTFPYTETESVNFEIVFSAPASQDMTLEAIWQHPPMGSKAGKWVYKYELHRGQNRIVGGCGWSEKGKWPKGSYAVDFWLQTNTVSHILGSVYVGGDDFHITDPSPQVGSIFSRASEFDIPSLYAWVKPIQFFRMPTENIPEFRDRVLAATFPSSDACVGLQLPIQYSSASTADRHFEIQAVWYKNYQELFRGKPIKCQHLSSEAGSLSVCHDSLCSSKWDAGANYQVKLFVDGKLVESGFPKVNP